MKKIGTLALALTLAGTLSVGALAEEPAPEAAVPTPSAYSVTLTVNGETLDTAGLPYAGRYLPMRLVAEADHGSAGWYEEENTGAFYLDGNVISVDFSTGAVTVNEETAADVKPLVIGGVTFLPADVLEGLEGYTVNHNPELDVERIDITTPNNAPLVKLAYQIMDETGMAFGMKNSPEDIASYLGIHTENFEDLVAFSPLNVNSDTVIIGKLAPDADVAQAKADLQARQDAMIAAFEHYLPGPLELAKNGRIAEHNGYLMLIISPDTDRAIALFEAATQA